MPHLSLCCTRIVLYVCESHRLILELLPFGQIKLTQAQASSTHARRKVRYSSVLASYTSPGFKTWLGSTWPAPRANGVDAWPMGMSPVMPLALSPLYAVVITAGTVSRRLISAGGSICYKFQVSTSCVSGLAGLVCHGTEGCAIGLH